MTQQNAQIRANTIRDRFNKGKSKKSDFVWLLQTVFQQFNALKHAENTQITDRAYINELEVQLFTTQIDLADAQGHLKDQKPVEALEKSYAVVKMAGGEVQQVISVKPLTLDEAQRRRKLVEDSLRTLESPEIQYIVVKITPIP